MVDGNQLQIPDAAKKDPKTFEVLRVWVANQRQHVSLRVGVWKDPVAWGIVLADLAGHIANAYQEDAGLDRIETMQRIRISLDAELESPTDEPSGQIQG